ncbi:P-loop containing nucleoside triphosphate hydrolase protein [Sphaerosporella brunnea]|uniref:P-loop containing nucleoside triphosphate hydrolase protein n=1 Tax=Sphaerosporella brunnea TaxID=1250544 RepID=A0A5J5ESK2_9PEZI|nr:P-loop containing nucleoside triphosphate hydrolase protein [Sphaerosporella brunnea]
MLGTRMCKARLSCSFSLLLRRHAATATRATTTTATRPPLAPIATATPRNRIWLPEHSRKQQRRNLHEAPIAPPATTLFPPSAEQQLAIDTLLNTRHNLIVDACAGSGKTTTILHLAAAAPREKFLVLVYNRRLMVETSERVQALGLQNVTVLNYHSLGSQYYTTECSTDQGLKRVVQDDMPVVAGKTLPECTVAVMDEQQDMTPILKQFVDKVFRDMGFVGEKKKKQRGKKQLRVVVLGDQRQEMYGFNNADSRFLTMAPRREVFGYLNDQPWVKADQPTSNRITKQNVSFINQQLLKPPLGNVMYGVKTVDENGKPFPKPRYVICDPWTDALDEILRLLNELEIHPSEIIILAPSVRVKAAAITLANDLALLGIPLHVANSDVTEISPEVAKGKILICTYHQSKGIERKAAVVFGFDDSYHTFYNRVPVPLTAVSNPQYVAATRAKEHLVLIHDHRMPVLPFADLSTMDDTCDVVTIRPLEETPAPPEEDKKRRTPTYAVTALTRNLPETLITKCIRLLDFKMIAPPAYGPHPPTEVEDTNGLIEGVSNITGTAAPAVYEWRSRGTCTALLSTFQLLKRPAHSRRWTALYKLPAAFYAKLQVIEAKLERQLLDESDILFLSNICMAQMDGLIAKLLAVPLDGYHWFTEAHAADIYHTLAGLEIPKRGTKYEKNFAHTFRDIAYGGGPACRGGGTGVTIKGCMDIARVSHPRKVWEIKYMQTLQAEHILQLALYMALLEARTSTTTDQAEQPPVEGYLVSAQSGQTLQIFPKTPDSFREILQLLVDAKSGGDTTGLLNTFSDEEFLDECRSGFETLVAPVALPVWFSMRPVGPKEFRALSGPKKASRKKKGGVQALDSLSSSPPLAVKKRSRKKKVVR